MPKNSTGITHSFVFDEVSRLLPFGIEVHVVRTLIDKQNSSSYNIHFHELDHKIDPAIIPFFIRHLTSFPLGFYLTPRSLYRLYNYGLRYGLKIAKTAKQWKADLIHAHFAYPEGMAALLAKNETTKPLVVTLHGFDILTDPSIGYGIRLDSPYNAIVKKVLHEADAIITASTATYKEALKVKTKKARLHLIPNGVDTTRFNASLNSDIIRKRYDLKKKFVVLAVRPHIPKNGLRYLIRAIPIVKKKIHDVVFIIGGYGPLRQFHEALARKLKVSSNTIFVGSIKQEELPFYYAACDVSVIPSVIEAFGLVTIESMSCGKPVIGSRVGGILDIIEDGVNGFLVNPRDPEAIAEKIIFLAEHPNLTTEMGKNARMIVEKKFDINKRVEKMIKVYHKIARV